MSDKVILSEYHGHEATASRHATVVKEKEGLAVELYEFEHMVEKRPLHTQQTNTLSRRMKHLEPLWTILEFPTEGF